MLFQVFSWCKNITLHLFERMRLLLLVLQYMPVLQPLCRGERTTFRSQLSSAMGSGEFRLSGCLESHFPPAGSSCWSWQEPDLWTHPCLLSTRVEILTALYFSSFLIREQESRPIKNGECFSSSVDECARQCVWLVEGLFSFHCGSGKSLHGKLLVDFESK